MLQARKVILLGYFLHFGLLPLFVVVFTGADGRLEPTVLSSVVHGVDLGHGVLHLLLIHFSHHAKIILIV